MSFGNKSVDVYVSNNSDAPSKRCVLELTVRKIGNAPVGRVTTAIIRTATGQVCENLGGCNEYSAQCHQPQRHNLKICGRLNLVCGRRILKVRDHVL
jgi:hypothetical protein